MSLERITNFLSIKPWLATAGMPTREQMELLPVHKFRNVINLALDDSPGALENEEQIVESIGLRYFHIPVIWEKPIKSDFDQFVSIMQSKENEKKIAVNVFINFWNSGICQSSKCREYSYSNASSVNLAKCRTGSTRLLGSSCTRGRILGAKPGAYHPD